MTTNVSPASSELRGTNNIGLIIAENPAFFLSTSVHYVESFQLPYLNGRMKGAECLAGGGASLEMALYQMLARQARQDIFRDDVTKSLTLSLARASSYLLGFSDYLAQQGDAMGAQQVQGFIYHLPEYLALAEIEREQNEGHSFGFHKLDFAYIVNILRLLEERDGLFAESSNQTTFQKRIAASASQRLTSLDGFLADRS